jgi:DNA-binding XRE family transcriptional regulator
MPKPPGRPYSRYSRDAVVLLGQLIRKGRIELKLTTGELAERAHVSRGLLFRMEKGDPSCAIGPVFEVAVIVGIRLFEADQSTLTGMVRTNQTSLSILPKRVRTPRGKVKDDF